ELQGIKSFGLNRRLQVESGQLRTEKDRSSHAPPACTGDCGIRRERGVQSRKVRRISKGLPMTPTTPPDITQLLQAWSQGEVSALEKLTPLVYTELHRLAHRYMGFENPGHTLQTTALVNEAYLRLVSNQASWQNRAHFYAISAQLMRQILV